VTPLEIVMFYVYVLQSKKDNLWYTGYTGDLAERLEEHIQGGVFSTKKDDARMRERYLRSGMGKRYLRNRMKSFLSLTG